MTNLSKLSVLGPEYVGDADLTNTVADRAFLFEIEMSVDASFQVAHGRLNMKLSNGEVEQLLDQLQGYAERR